MGKSIIDVYRLGQGSTTDEISYELLDAPY